jgi:hypothetical protein
VRLREASASEPLMTCRKRISCHVLLYTRMDETAPIDSAALFGSSFWVDDVKTGGNGKNPMFNGRRQPSRGGTSRMMREYQVRFCERLGVNSPGLLGTG